MAEELFSLAQFHQAAQVDDRNAVAYETHDRQIVRDEQVGQAALLLQFRHQVEHLRADRHVQRGDGLVRDDELRLHDQRTGNADALALAAGKLMRETAGELGQQAYFTERVRDPALALLF